MSRLRFRHLLMPLLLVVVLSGVCSTNTRQEGLCMTALDVGQGDALLLEFPEGLPWLIDGGGIPGSRIDIGVRRVLPALRARGVDQLGLVVLTHGDADHAGGLFAVLEQLRVDQLLLPRGRRVGAAERSLISLAEQRGVSVIVSDEGAVLPELAGGVTADLLHPLAGWRFTNESTNDGSVVLRVVLGAVGFLLTGDIEAAAEEHLLRSDLDLRATVLKLAHHGSRTSSSGDFLDRVRPMVALAGIGKENRFGFPHQGTISRLRERDVELYWTGRHGELRVCTDGLALTVDTRPEGRWLRSLEYSAQEVAGWAVRPPDPSLPDSSPSEVEGVAETLDLDTVRTSRRTPRVRGGKGRQRPRGLKDSTRDKEAVPPPAPRLMDDRQWERSRKERGVRRPPWKSRR